MKELLVPVGNMDSLKAAVMNGADAIYLGGKRFGARAFAGNFNDEEMISAIHFAHLYGVKIYVTVNTVVFESELEDVYNYCLFLHKTGVDALIVQDLGLMSLLKRRLPNLEIHASTQVHNVSESGLRILEDLNVKRVVFARELSLATIDSYKTSMEKEIFIHGALCVSYSGECLFSSVLLGRSGNRGECAQVCRLPYKLLENDEFVKTDSKYLLSTKELKTVSKFKEIMDSSVKSLKIEGRMKSPEYVACVTRLYRNLIDYYYGKDCLRVSKYEEDLKVIFNRQYTYGYLFNATNDEIINIHTSNHVGVHLGKVFKVTNKYIYIKLDSQLNQGDGIRINETNDGMIVNFLYDESLKLTSVCKNSAVIDNKIKASVGDSVNKTSDITIINKYRELPVRKVDIDVMFTHNENCATLEITDGINVVKKEADIVFPSKNISIKKEDIIKQLSKLGNTPFKIANISVGEFESKFINIKDLNAIRRNAVEELIFIRENSKKEVIQRKDNEEMHKNSLEEKLTLSVLVRDEEQLLKCLTYFDRIYVIDRNLYNLYKDNPKIYYRGSRIYEKTNIKNTLATELGEIYDGAKISDYFLNITNHETLDYLSKYVDINTLSIELEDDNIERIMKHNNYNVEMLLYSTFELMITKYCPVNKVANKDTVCTKCMKNEYKLVDRNGSKYPIKTDVKNHLTHILDSKVTNNLEKLKYYYNLGIRNFRIELNSEDSKEIDDIIKNLDNQKSNLN
ncbi:putative uncharacterized protein [Firmicutes bacterium CAG:582]|nr:putative uncharacterized protein [Firmicutes bacterium CAG:582]